MLMKFSTLKKKKKQSHPQSNKSINLGVNSTNRRKRRRNMWTIKTKRKAQRGGHISGREDFAKKSVFLEGQVGRVCPPLNHRFPERNSESHQTLMIRYPQRIQDLIIAVPSSKPPQSGVTLDTAQLKAISWSVSDGGIKKMWFTYKGILFSLEKALS